MAARITTVTPDLIWSPEDVQHLWFFPNGSAYLRYSPHFHMICRGGFRQNLTLTHMFVVVYEGKFSVKSFDGLTYQRIEVRDQIWFLRGSQIQAHAIYSMLLPGKEAYARSGRTRSRLAS